MRPLPGVRPGRMAAGGLLASSVLLAACRSVPAEPWIEWGTTRGTIEKRETASGFEVRFRDLRGRVLRQETRDREGNLVPGPSVTTFEYDASGRQVEMAFRDSADELVRNPEGYAVERIRYSREADGAKEREVTYYDEADRPTTVADGYARARFTAGKDPQWKEEMVLLDLRGRPVEARFLDRPGVARVRFADVEGVGPVRFAVLYALDGRLIERVKISGTTEAFRSWVY